MRVLALMMVLAVACGQGANGPSPSAAARASTTSGPTPTQVTKGGPPQPSTTVWCGAVSQFAAPTATTGGSITIDRPAGRRDRGGPVTFGLPPGPLATPAAGWTCVRFIPAVPAAAFVGLVAPGTDGYLGQPSPTPRGEYANPSLLYYFTLAEPYRRSDVLSSDHMGPDVASGSLPATSEAFTARTTQDEATLAAQRCDTACAIWNYVAVVEMYTNLDSPRQWYTKRGAAAGEIIEDLMIDGRAAVKVTNGATYPVQLIINDRTWMLRVAYQLYAADLGPAPAGASKAKLEQVLASFHFTQ